ncbi:MAG: FecR domain-containing protein [Hyphomicrobiales bacterium]
MAWVSNSLALVLAVYIAGIGPAWAAPGGKTVGVKPLATLITGGGSSQLAVGKLVYGGDKITTGSGGEAQILFPDNTKLVVGPGSSLVIDDYVANSGGSAKKLALGAAAGVFRFVSGTSHGAYSINTPSATFGIRGTAFDFAIVNRRTLLLQYQGAVNLCGRGGSCALVNNTCEIAATNERGKPLKSTQDGFEVGNADLKKAFRYAFSQDSLASNFRIARAGSCRDSVGRADRAAAASAASAPSSSKGSSGRSDRSRGESAPSGGGFD